MPFHISYIYISLTFMVSLLVEVTVLAFAVDSELCSEEMDQMYSVFRLASESLDTKQMETLSISM